MNKELEFQIDPPINGYTCLSASMAAYLFYTTVERVSQHRIFDIGHLAEANLRSYISDGKKQPVEGIGSTGVIAIAKKFNHRGFITRKGDLSKIEFFIGQDIPVLINFQCNPDALGESGHYGVITGVRDGDVIVADPRRGIEHGLFREPYSEFEGVWYDPVPSSGKWMAAFWPLERIIKVPFRGLLI